MPTMPNLVGLDLPEAQAALQASGILNPGAIGYFGTWPITVQWVSSSFWSQFFADSLLDVDSPVTSDSGGSIPPTPGTIINQSIVTGGSVAVNAPLQLTAIQYPLGVAYP